MMKKRILYEKNAPQARFVCKTNYTWDTHYQFSIKTLLSKNAAGKTYQTKCAAG